MADEERDRSPTLRVLSLGAGVQSTALALMAAAGELEPLDAAIFADTGWEPQRVYDHLDRLAGVLDEAGIPLHRVQYRNIRDDALSGGWNRLPLYLRNGDGSPGMAHRQCTQQYKLNPLKRQVRRLLGAKTSTSGAVLSPPVGAVAEQWIGFSADEIGRVSGKERDAYIVTRHPLIERGMTRRDCIGWLTARGWGDTPKSACIGCPFHGNRAWRDLRDERPQEWADAVAFDRDLRAFPPKGLTGVGYLHASRAPLDEAPIDRVTRAEVRELQGDLFELAAEDARLEDGDPDGCSPYGCRSGEPAAP